VLLDVGVYEQLIDEVAVIRELRIAESQLDAGMGIPHDVVVERLGKQLPE
jgi:hypothetical protein